MPVDDARPSTSGEGTLSSPRTSPMRMSDDQCDESGSNKKRKPHSTDAEYDETAKKLRIARNDSPQLERHSDVADDTDSTGSISSRDPVLPRTVDVERTYNTSSLKQAFHGMVYQLKYLMLILHRAWKKGYSYRLDTEMAGSKKFDDIVLEYKDRKGKKVHRFMQINHNLDDRQMVKATDLLNVKDGNFSILKYFISWRKIKENPNLKNTSKEFILCTNMGLDVEGLNTKNIKVKVVVADDLLKVAVSSQRTPHSYKLENEPSCLYDELKSATGASESEISEFLTEFTLTVNQPNEIELGTLIKQEIGAYSQFNLLSVDFILQSSFENLISWLKKSVYHGKFLTREEADEFFVAIERKLSSLITVGANLPYSAELELYAIKFTLENSDIQEFLDGKRLQILKLTCCGSTLLTALRVYQTVKEDKRYQKNDSFILIHLEKLLLLNIMRQVLRAFKSSGTHHLLVIDCALSDITRDAPLLWNRLNEIMQANHCKMMILITGGNKDLAVGSERVITISDLTKDSRQKLLERRIIKFQGHDESMSFGRLLGIHDCSNIELENLSALRRIINQETLTQLIQGKEISIGGEIIGLGEVEKYYIPRTITGHVVIRRSVLQDPKIPDLFAISGIDLKSSEKLLAPEEGTHDFDESNATKLDLVKCCFLEKDRAEDHFKNICDQNPNRNIHWLQAESGKLLWQRSHGNITSLMAFEETVVHDENAERPGVRYFTEDQLMHHAEECKIVIISDTAGMGKSTVLTHFAEKIKHNQPSSLVIKVDLTQHTSVLDKQKQKRTFNATDTAEAVDSVVDKLSCLDTELERKVFKEIIKVTGGAAILFDGYDEISPEYESIVLDLLQALSRSRMNRLFVTTRPHTSEELKKKLDTFSYHLQPFSRTNQTKFLIAFWKKGLNSSDDNETVEENLYKHASKVLKILNESIDRRMEDFTGIPLLTRMVAEIFPFEAVGRQIDLDISKKAWKIIDLYRLFVEKQTEVFCEEKQLGAGTSFAHRMFSKLTGRIIMIIHQKLALEALIPEHTVRDLRSCQPIIDEMSSFFPEMIESVEQIGIVTQVISKTPHFIHRTFAEYFAAQFLIDTLIDNRRNEVVRKFFVAEIFVQPQYETIRAFLNCFLSDRDYASDDEKESWKFSLSEHCNGFGQTLYHIAVGVNNNKIIRFFLHRLSKLDSLKQEANIDLRDYLSQTPLHRAIIFGKSDIVKLLVDARADINSVDSDGLTPLHYAVTTKDLNIVQYIVKAGARIDSADSDGLTPLHYAIKTQNLDIVRHIVEAGARIKSVDSDGLTPLHYAIRTQKLDIVRHIVEAGALIKSVDSDGLTPLHHAVKTGDSNIVQYIVEAGARIDSADSDGLTSLHYAIRTQNLNIVGHIVEAGARINSVDGHGLTPLHYAVKTHDLNIVRYIVEAGADINTVTMDGLTLLHYAVETKDLNIVRYIVEVGADINSVTMDGLTLLHHAVKTGDLNIVKYIVEAGADISSATKAGLTPLHYAVKTHDLNIVRYIVEAGADINSQTKNGLTPLHHAVQTKDLEIVKYVFEKGADINSAAMDGLTLLHYAVETKDLNIVRYIVEAGANIYSQTKNGLTPLHYALQTKDLEIVRYIVEAGAIINFVDKYGLTPLHLAVKTRDLSIVRCLVEAGADNHYTSGIEGSDMVAVINFKDNDGITPLHLAVISGSSEIVQYLLEKSANVNSETDSGLTPRHIAVHLGDSSIVACLDEHGANLDREADCRSIPEQLVPIVESLIKMTSYQDMIYQRCYCPQLRYGRYTVWNCE